MPTQEGVVTITILDDRRGAILNIKVRIIRLLMEFEDGKYSNLLLNDYFREEGKNLNRKEKAFITEVFYGVIRNLIFLDHQIEKRSKKVHRRWLKNLLRISMYQAYYMDNGDDAGIVWEGTELAKEKLGTYVGSFVNGILRTFLREAHHEEEILREDDMLDVFYSYPRWFYDKVCEEYGDKAEDVLKSYKKTPAMCIRVNTLSYSEEEFEELLDKKGLKLLKYIEGGVYYINSGSLIDTREFREGKIVPQDGSSYLAAATLGAVAGENVLDTCSAPGTKTMTIAEGMENTGSITALDVHNHKVRLIRRSAKRMGITIVDAKKLDAREVETLGMEFDKILIDAPCSGYGVIRKKPEALYNKDMDNVEELAQLQAEILTAASKVLKVGGEMVYSTCTIFKEENTDNLKKFLDANPNYEVVDIEMPSNVKGHFDSLGGYSIDYREEYLDGFYIVKLRRKA